MKVYDIEKIFARMNTEGIALAEKLGYDVKNDCFEIVQQLSDGQSITITMDNKEDGTRAMNVEVYDSTIFLPPIEGTLNIFTGGDD